MSSTAGSKSLLERLKTLRPRRAVRRRIVQVAFGLLTLFLLAECAGAVFLLAGGELPL